MTILVVISSLVLGQVIWAMHQQSKREEYQRLFLSQVYLFLDLTSVGSRAEMQACIDRERLYVAAQEAVDREIFVWPWRWITRWNADYLCES